MIREPVKEVLYGVLVFFNLVKLVHVSVEDVFANPLIGDFKVTLIQHRLSPLLLLGTIPPQSREDNGPIL